MSSIDQRTFPLSPLQKGMVFHTLKNPDSGLYIQQLIAEVHEEINVPAFSWAIRQILKRHPNLRVRISFTAEEEPTQTIPRTVRCPITHRNWRRYSAARQERKFQEFLQRDRQRGFELHQCPLMRFTFFHLTDHHHKLVWTSHHCLLDGRSRIILLQELLALYQAKQAGRKLELPKPVPFWKFLDWLQSQAVEPQKHFWQASLTGVDGPTPLSIDHPQASPPSQSTVGRYSFICTETSTAGLTALCKSTEVTLNTILIGAWALILSRYTHQSDVVFGVTRKGRAGTLEGIQDMVGLFINTVPLRLTIPRYEQIPTWLKHIRAQWRALGPFEQTPLLDIQKWTQDLQGAPLFESLVVYDHQSLDSSLRLQQTSGPSWTFRVDGLTNFPLVISGFGGKRLTIELVYHPHRLPSDSIERLAGHLQQVLEAFATQPAQTLNDISLLTPHEKQQLLEGNDSAIAYSPGPTIVSLLEAQVAKTPQAIAVIYNDHQLTYAQLNQRANQLASYLLRQGVKTDVRLGVCLERGLDLAISLVAILKTGAAYVPLDPTVPSERLGYMIDDAGIRLVLTTTVLQNTLPASPSQIIAIDTVWPNIQREPSKNPNLVMIPENPAYVIYTSGSTGKPKGVVVNHHNVVRLFQASQGHFHFNEQDVWTLFHSYAFDFSVWELWGALLYGGKIVVVPYDSSRAPDTFSTLVQDQRVTILNQTPSAFRLLMEQVQTAKPLQPLSLRWVIFGGEALNVPSLRPWVTHYGDSQPRLMNMYGITETTVHVTHHQVTEEEIDQAQGSPIGFPLADLRTYLLDPFGHLVPYRVPGELYIGGAGVAQGYLNRPMLTAERFVPDSYGHRAGHRLYKSGDLARSAPGGHLQYVGRRDGQVKVRGFRIELGEIEMALSQHPQVQETVVVCREDRHMNLRGYPDEKQIVSYVVGAAETLEVHALRTFLQERLPGYMVPSAFVVLEKLPLTSNGKIDRKALPAPSFTHITDIHNYLPPRTPTEIQLSQIWAQVLHAPQVGISDNFFSIGGHSLLATQVVARVRKTLNVELPLQTLFDTPTIQAVAKVIDQLNPEIPDETRPILGSMNRPALLPLSFAQERLWFLDRWEPDSSLYNMAVAYQIEGSFSIEKWERALQNLVNRHETLRTTFGEQDGVPIQVIHDEKPLHLHLMDLSQEDDAQRSQQILTYTSAEAHRPFDLTAGPLIRASIIRSNTEEHLFLLTLHHIISDGWSLDMLLKELSLLYTAEITNNPAPLSALSIQYADFAIWQREHLQGKLLHDHLIYWRNQLRGAPPILQIPTDHPRPALPSYQGRRHSVRFPAELSQALHVLSEREGVTLFMVMLAVFQILLARYTGQFDVVVGTPIANRSEEELEGINGFFANTLVLRAQLVRAMPFTEVLRHVRDVCLGAYAHQDVPFEKLVEELQPERDLSRNPLFQVMFQLYTPHDLGVPIPHLTIKRHILDSGTSKFDLLFSLGDRGEELYGGIEYATELFQESTIVRLVGHYQRLLEEIIADPSKRIDQLPILTPAEETQLVVHCNTTQADFPQQMCLHELVERQTRRTPDAVAVSFGDQEVTYAKLHHQAQTLARYLQSLGIGPDVCVGICVERSVDMVVAVLAVLQAGGAYMPLDPTYPQTRLNFMLTDAKVAVLLTQRRFQNLFVSTSVTLVLLDEGLPGSLESLSALEPTSRHPTNLAYVIYTSGSTGQPKGVAMPHRAIVNLITWQRPHTTARPESRTLQATSLNFDVSVQEIFTTLGSGGTLVLVSDDQRREPLTLLRLLKTSQIERLFLPVVALNQLAEVAEDWEVVPATLQEITTAGEALQITPLLRRFFSHLPHCTLHNHYGPTETHVCTAFTLEESWNDWAILPPIGQPIANEKAYVVDAFLQPVPIGMPGQLLVGGVGLARGYLHRPALTSQRFCPNPFSKTKGDLLYQTGDMVRWRADGILEFIGRIDHQRKLRGYRIEPGEIEVCLERHEGVHKAVVAIYGDEDHQQLVAYVVQTPSTSHLGPEDLRAFLENHLPAYMVPTAWVFLNKFPLTPTGKINRGALPPPSSSGQSTPDFVPPNTPEEIRLAAIWQRLLNIQHVGRHDNFFRLGGHSLLGMKLISQVHKAFGEELSIRRLFEAPTLQQMAADLATGSSFEDTAIRSHPRGAALPLSYAQQRVWFLEQWEPESALYNLPVVFRLRGSLHLQALQAAIEALVARHESLRTVFPTMNGIPQQHIQTMEDLTRPTLIVLDRRKEDSAIRGVSSQEVIQEETHRPFDLTTGPLFRAHLLQESDTESLLILTFHHIIADRWSLEVLFKELSLLYDAEVTKTHATLPTLPIQYGDFTVWQRDWLQGEVLTRQLTYWKLQLHEAPPVLELPMDYPRPPVSSYRGAKHPFTVSPKITRQLQSLSQEHEVSQFMTLLAAFQVFLARYTEQTDIIVGTPIANRQRQELGGLIGFLVNTLVLRTKLSGNPTFTELLTRVRETCLGAYAHQDLPFEKLVEELQPERDISRNPLVQIMMQLEVRDIQELSMKGLEIERLPYDGGQAKFDLNLIFIEEGGTLTGTLEYSTDLFSGKTIGRMAGHFQTLLETLVAFPDQPVWSISFLSDTEREQQLLFWTNNTNEVTGLTILDLLEAQVAQTPEAVAVINENDNVQLTYAELNLRSNQLGHHLRRLGVGPDIHVGVCMERSPDLVISLLGILKAGGAFVPIDPGYPRDRQAYMLTDAHPKVLLTHQDLAGTLPRFDGRIVCLDKAWPSLEQESRTALPRTVTLDNLAYIIYTSGSTGKPKGAMNTHGGISNRLQWMQSTYHLTSSDRVVQKTPISFDVSVWEVFWPLLTGAGLVMARPGGHKDSRYLVQLLIEQRVTTVHFVPSLLQVVLDEPALSHCHSLQRVICSGETLSTVLQTHFFSRMAMELHNLYGPTEAAIDVTAWTCQREDPYRSVSIGRPISNTSIRLLAASQHPVPLGCPGELFIGGCQLARGYLDRPDLTAEKFVPQPLGGELGARHYRTGDRARFREDGNLEFLGRIDRQVKLRGFRIELEEIEAVLREDPMVQDAAVLLRDDHLGEHQLIAYVVPSLKETVHPDTLYMGLKTQLPEYMIPSHFVILERLPLTPTGKINRQALPAPSPSTLLQTQYVAPETLDETRLASLWKSLLHVERVGRHDNFFKLGGHSLLGFSLILQIQKEFGKDLSIRSLFEAPTLQEMAIELGKKTFNEWSMIPPEGINDVRPLSYAQERLWFLDHWKPNSPLYTIPLVFRLTGDLDVRILAQTINRLIARHENLRIVFPEMNGIPRQHIPMREEPTTSTLVVLDRRKENRDITTQRVIQDETTRPFDLSKGPLFRAKLVRETDTESLLILTFHHIIADGWSLEVLLKEFSLLYNAGVSQTHLTLPDLPIQYADYARWQRNWLQGEALTRQVTYWKQQLHGIPPVLEFPTDYPRPAVPSYLGAQYQFAVPSKVARQLQGLSQQYGVSLFMTLLAAFTVLLARYTGRTDIVVGTPMANRQRKELVDLVGFFVNTVVLRTKLSHNPTFIELLTRVRETCLEALAHQDLPFEKLVEELQPERDTSRNPLFQIMMQLQTRDSQELSMNGLEVERLPTDSGLAKFDLNLIFVQEAGLLTGNLQYSTDLFTEHTIRRLSHHFQTLLETLVASPDRSVLEIPFLSNTERKQQLVEWNDTAGSYPSESCVHELFEAQVEKTPEAIALSYEGLQLTYAQLNQRANRLAVSLQQQGVTRGSMVPVIMERGPELIISYLGIMKTGAAFSPLDPEWPPERLKALLSELPSPVVVTTPNTLLPPSPDLGKEIIAFEADSLGGLSENPLPLITPDDPIYVLFTSGSSGLPKGAINHHRGLVNRLWNMQQHYPWTSEDVFLGVLRHTFDASLGQILWPLLHGARLVLPPPTPWLNFHELIALIEQEQVTLTGLVPSVFTLLVEEMTKLPPLGRRLDSLRHLHIGGEALQATPVNRFLAMCPHVRVSNTYGPTEISISTIYHQISEPCTDPIPLGRPLKNVHAIILDDHLNVVPAGVSGELHLGGICVGYGYLRNPGKTAAVFIPNPFPELNGSVLYKTGDQAFFQHDGTIQFLGRKDYQVKINGVRMELGEIEAVLQKHPTVAQAVVVAQKSSGGKKRLVGYVTARSETGDGILEVDLKEFVSQYLPAYMIPSALMHLDRFPLLLNGKVNIHALPSPQAASDAQKEVESPQTSFEERLSRIFSEELQVETLGRHDNFFLSGGHSLLAMIVVSRIQRLFGVTLEVRALFDHPTIATLAAYLQTQGERPTASGKKLDLPKGMAASSFHEAGIRPFPKTGSPLVDLQNGGTSPPFFCVHPIGGGVSCYQGLVKLLGNLQPFYGVQGLNFIPTLNPDLTLEELARQYIHHILTIQPDGPFRLGGWSLGGVIAQEMATQLERLNHRVELVALIDSFHPQPLDASTEDGQTKAWKHFWESLSGGEPLCPEDFPLDWPAPHLPEETMLSALLTYGINRGVLPVGTKLSHCQHLWQIFHVLFQAMNLHVPKPFSGTLSLFQASEHDARVNKKAQADWEGVANQGIEIFSIPGNHYSIFDPPAIPTMAAFLQACLSRKSVAPPIQESSQGHPHPNQPSSSSVRSQQAHSPPDFLKDLPEGFRLVHRPLDSMIEEGEILPVESVALYYLPVHYLKDSGLTRDEMIHGWYDNQPTLTHVLETSLGRIGLLMLPLTGMELYTETEKLLESSIHALEFSRKAGARTVSLTGLLPSATEYGKAIQNVRVDRPGIPQITTGHGTTAATVVLAIQKILTESRRHLSSETVGFLGLGSIGLASLRLMLHCLPHPKALLLCDVYQQQEKLEAIRQEVFSVHGFQGNIRLIQSTEIVPDTFYESRLIVGATNVPNVLDVSRLQPGTLIVDDSGPHCFESAKAIDRLTAQRDILFTEGGILQSPTLIQCLRYIPQIARTQMTQDMANNFARYHPLRITGCVLSSILLAKVENQKAVCGLVDVETGVENFNTLLRLGYDASDLNCEGYTLPPDAINDVAANYGASL